MPVVWPKLRVPVAPKRLLVSDESRPVICGVSATRCDLAYERSVAVRRQTVTIDATHLSAHRQEIAQRRGIGLVRAFRAAPRTIWYTREICLVRTLRTPRRT